MIILTIFSSLLPQVFYIFPLLWSIKQSNLPYYLRIPEDHLQEKCLIRYNGV